MNTICVLILIILYLNSTTSLLSRRRLPPKPKPKPPYINKDANANLQIPNKQFCSKMNLQPSAQYLVLPWWFHHCQEWKEREEGKTTHRYVRNLSLYRRMLDHINYLKKHLNVTQ